MILMLDDNTTTSRTIITRLGMNWGMNTPAILEVPVRLRHPPHHARSRPHA